MPRRILVNKAKKLSNRLRRLTLREVLEEPIHKRNLSVLQFLTSFRNREETDFVDLLKCLEFSRTDRPLGCKGVTGMDVASRHIPFTRPCVNRLTAFLQDCPECDKGAEGYKADLFAKLPLRGSEEIFPFVRFAFRNGPVSVVFARKERTAGMCEENFRLALSPASALRCRDVRDHD